MPYYYYLKKEYDTPVFFVNKIEKINNRMFKVHMKNSGLKEKIIWNFYFDSKNKIQKFEKEITFSNNK